MESILKEVLKKTIDGVKISRIFKELSIDGLNLMKVIENNNKHRIGINNIIDMRIKGINNQGTRSGNGSDESQRLEWIKKQINNDTEWGQGFKKDYQDFYNKEIKEIKNTGTRKKHYDFLIIHTDGTSIRCEEKGNKGKYDLDLSETPWQKAVQRVNGNPKDFNICRIFAKLWYDTIIYSEHINSMIGNILPIPSFDEWYKGDCCTQGNPKTEWGMQNKTNVKEKWKDGNKSISLNKRNGVPIDGRALIIDGFKGSFTNDVKENLLQEIHTKLNYFMNEKDIWITTCGQVPNINYRFWNKFEPEKIEDIVIKYNKGSDIIFSCITEDKKNNFECYLRWGKGCGFSNLRFDIR